MAEIITDALLTNSRVYREIAVDSEREAQMALYENTTVREDGGKVFRYDPLQRSFKASLVAIAFAGMYIEALCWLVGCARMGVDAYRPVDRQQLEKRLEVLGVADKHLLEDARSFREMRNELIHENALPSSMDQTPIRPAQLAATFAVTLLKRIERAFGVSSC